MPRASAAARASEAVGQAEEVAIARHPLLELALRHHVTKRDTAISFATRPYLVEPYCDLPRIEGADISKAVQAGWTEMLVQLALYEAGWEGRHVGYVLTKGDARDQFAKDRIERPVDRVEAYRARKPGGALGPPGDGAWNLKMKAFGRGSLKFLGSNVANDFTEFSADTLIVDEYDHMDHGNLALAKDRVRESPSPRIVNVGNPTGPGEGIAALFDRGDGRRWQWKCARCGEWQALEWEANIVRRLESGSYGALDAERAEAGSGPMRPCCRRCHEPWDREPTSGAWVAERPLERRRSYTMSRLDVLHQDLRALLVEWNGILGNPGARLVFRRNVLGEATNAEGVRVTPSMVQACATGPEMDAGRGGEAYEAERVVAGIDVGSVLHVTISVLGRSAGGKRIRRGRYLATVPSFEELWALLVAFRVHVAVVDQGPELHEVRKLIERAREAGGRLAVWACHFSPGERIGSEPYALRLDPRARVATVDRTQLLDAAYEEFAATPPLRELPRDIARVEGFSRMMAAPVRQLVPGKDRYEWTKTSAPDHYRLADAYERVAADIDGRGGYFASFSL